MASRTWLLLLAVWTCGCYRSHAPIADASVAPPIDAGPACEYSILGVHADDIHCSIAANSTAACAEAAQCVCAARGRMTTTDSLRCTGSELTPRGAITFADFCTVEPPARMNMTEALEGYFSGSSDLHISAACDDVPALIGAQPFDECALLAELVCPCGPDPCDLDALLGRSCLSLTHAQANCIRDSLPANASCPSSVAAIVHGCGG